MFSIRLKQKTIKNKIRIGSHKNGSFWDPQDKNNHLIAADLTKQPPRTQAIVLNSLLEKKVENFDSWHLGSRTI